MSQVANKFSNNNANNAKKPFCKVCFDAGKADTAHFIRKTPDPKSQVICPTLLALECRYCFQHGHTVKYCTVLKQQDKADSKNRRVIGNQNQNQNQNQNPTQIKNTNKFAVFEDEDELELIQQLEQQHISVALEQQFPTLNTLNIIATNKIAIETLATQDNLQFPTLSTKTKTTTNTNTNTTNKWAAMASVAANKPIPIIKQQEPIITKQTQINTTKWADDDDESFADDDDENFDYDENFEQPPVSYTYTYAPVSQTFYSYAANDDDW
jgi:hypothetical protein